MKVCLIAQFPPPIHGLSKAVDTLYNSRLYDKYEFEKIDISSNKLLISNCIKIIRSKADLFYFTLSQSIFGNIRDMLLLWIVRRKKKKSIVHLHGGYYRELVDKDMSLVQRKMNYRCMVNIDAGIVLSKSLTKIFEGMIDSNSVYVVQNCIDDYFLTDEHTTVSAIKDDAKHVLYLSNFIPSKGYKKVLDMALLSQKRNDSFHYDFAGCFFNKAEEKNFFDYISDNNLDDRITYHGVVDGEKKRILLANSDIFVLLTRYKKEGQPISIIEAMGNGLAVVATNHAAIPDMIVDGENGLLIENESDIEDILNKMSSLNFDNIRINNVKLVKNQYSQNMYIDNLDDVFEKVLKI